MSQEFRSHEELASALRARVLKTGATERETRLAVLERGAGGPPAPAPYDALAHQIAADSVAVTDAQLDDVLRAAGSEKGAFEIVLAASIGAGLYRWDAAASIIRMADDAAP